MRRALRSSEAHTRKILLLFWAKFLYAFEHYIGFIFFQVIFDLYDTILPANLLVFLLLGRHPDDGGKNMRRPNESWVFYDELNTLPQSPRDRAILEFRLGLSDEDGGNHIDYQVHTLKETAERFGITRQDVRSLEARVLARHRHPSRNR